MPSSSSVREQLTDIVVRLVGCPPEAVVPEATLKELGTDSLTIVELAEELGRRFDVYLTDDTVDSLVTVQDAIDSVVHHDGGRPPADAARVPTSFESPAPPPRRSPDAHRRGLATRLAITFGLVGAGVGIVLGLGGSALVNASGIDAVDLPPIVAPTTTPTPTETTAPTPTTPTETTKDDPGVPDPTIKGPDGGVRPGERFILSGHFPGLDKGTDLQVQVKDEGGDWDDFPIETETRDAKGRFKTELYTSRTGKRQFRLTDKATDKSTPATTVQIG